MNTCNAWLASELGKRSVVSTYNHAVAAVHIIGKYKTLPITSSSRPRSNARQIEERNENKREPETSTDNLESARTIFEMNEDGVFRKRLHERELDNMYFHHITTAWDALIEEH